jgi:tetratricopeptide (TPR) repeat protein
MLAFEAADVRGRTEAGTQFGEEAGVAEESKTMVIMPGEEEERALVTSFLATEGAPFQEEERQKTAERPLSEVEEFLEKGFSAEIPEDDPILTRPRDVRNATRAAAEERDREEKEQKKRERPRPEPKPKPVRIPTPPIPVIPPLEEATDEPDAARTRPLSADAMVRVATPIPQEAQPADDKGNAGAEAAARQTLAMEIGPEASEKIESEGAAHVEALLKRAVEEAEKAVASRGKESALPPLPPAPRPILVPPLDVLATPGPIETPALIERVLSERILLALTEPPPLPERPPVPEPGTDEKIERTLEDVYRSMLSRNLYQVLNVTPFSPLSAIRDSGIRLRAKYEPAQYKGYMLSARARLLLRFVGEEIDRACAVLVDPAERTAYDNRINTDYGQDRRLALSYLFEAERNCDEGKASIEANNWPDALILFSKAAEANPRDPEYLAFRGWATYQALKAGQSSDSFAPNKARNILERALAVDPRHARALLFIARIEKEMGNLAAARTWYGRLQKVDPANEEALVQLDWLRTAVESEKPREESGVWDRFKGLFKKK